MPTGQRRHRGFTIIELLVTVAIVSVMATVAIPVAELASRRNKEQQLHAALWEIRRALDAYKQASDEGHIVATAGGSGYPPDLQTLVTGVIDARSPEGRRMYFLRRIPRDPFAADDRAAEETWGKRSYESPPDKPEKGADVFDVYSLSDATALNGTAYRSW